MKHHLYHTFSDIELAERLRQDDDRAFRELYERYWETLINTAYKRLDSIEKAEDLVQNLFVNIYRNRSAFEIHSSLEAYLKTSLKRLVFNQYRSEHYAQKYAEHILSQPSTEESENPQQQLQKKELTQRIDQALMAVPEKARKVFRLAKIEKRSHREISEILNISVSTIEKHIAKATYILRHELRNELRDDHLLGVFLIFPFFFK